MPVRWAVEFVQDTLVDGRRFRALAIVSGFTRECLGLAVDHSLSGVRVARELNAMIEHRGRPYIVVSDNGTEFTSREILKWSQEEIGRLALHRAGKADAERLCRALHRWAA